MSEYNPCSQCGYDSSAYKELRKSRDELLSKLKEVKNSGILPDGDGIDISTMLWLERIIEKAEALKC